MPKSTDVPHAVNAVAVRLRRRGWSLPDLETIRNVPPRTYEARKTSPDTLDVPATGESYHLCRKYLFQIDNRDDEPIGGVRLALERQSGEARVLKQVRRTRAGARAMAHLHDEQRLGVQARSDVAASTLLRSQSSEYLVLPLMAGDLTSMRDMRGLGRDTAMLLGLRAVLQDLRRCHALGVAHRDIKPANVLHRGTPETVRLGDYGLARPLKTLGHGTGTAHHMAPEQHRARAGEAKGHALAPADVWGVGATFLDIWVGNPFRCMDSQHRGTLHAAYARWHKRTQSRWRWRLGGTSTMRFARAFGRLAAEVRPLMLALLHPDPEKRPKVDDALRRVEQLLARAGDKDVAGARTLYMKAAQGMCERWDLS